jgi:hypothetical protein
MIDLSYTNKDGVNLYEGFDNGFDYHRDGAAEGDGYAHGGYPEITGETSPYTDTSYKTGDDPDFFDNGNVWVQPEVNPGPGPGPEPEAPASISVVAQRGTLNRAYDSEQEKNHYTGTFSADLYMLATYEDSSKKILTTMDVSEEIEDPYSTLNSLYEEYEVDSYEQITGFTTSPYSVGDTIDVYLSEDENLEATVTYLDISDTYRIAFTETK